MSVLICRRSDISTHWRKILASLRTMLPEAGFYYELDTSIYGHVQLRLGNGPSETTLRYDGRTIPLVPFLDVTPGQAHKYWLAWHEGWRDPQTGTGQNRQQFGSSSISIYAGSPGSNKQQVLRAEWAGGEIWGKGKEQQVVFQGKGAAHPHWHLAGLDPIDLEGDASPTGTSTSEASLSDFAKELNAGPAAQDLTDLLSKSPEASLAHIEPAWANIHLATSAQWAQEEWLGPGGPHHMHATNPANCDELRSWLISCVRYLQSELQGQILRGRR